MKLLLQRSGITRQTIHFYLRKGLLPKPLRTSRTYALYPPHSIELLSILKECQTRLRFSLDEIADLFAGANYDIGQIRSTLKNHQAPAEHPLNVVRSEPRNVKSEELLGELQPRPPQGWIDELRRRGLVRADGRNLSPNTAELVASIWELSNLGIKLDSLSGIGARIDEQAEAELSEFWRAWDPKRRAKVEYVDAIRIFAALDRFVAANRRDAVRKRFLMRTYRSADLFVGPNQKHFFPSETFLAKRGLNRAIDGALNALDRDPENRAALIDLARAYYLRSDWLNLYGVSQKILELDPMSPRAIADMSRAMYYLGRVDDSVRLLEQRLLLGSDPLLKFRLGQCLLLRAKSDSVPALLAAVVRKQQLSAEALREAREPAIRRWITLDLALDNLSVSDPLQLHQPGVEELEKLHAEYQSITDKDLRPLSKISLAMGKMLAAYALYLVYRRHKHPKTEQLRRKVIQMDPDGVLATRTVKSQAGSHRTSTGGKRKLKRAS